MPPADKNEVHRLISSECSNHVGKPALDSFWVTIHSYIRDRYSPFKSPNTYNTQNSKAISQVHQRVEKTLASWRGED